MSIQNKPADSQGAVVRVLFEQLSSRNLPIFLAFLAILLALPCLWVGWVADDHFHRLKILGSSRFEDDSISSLDLFNFFDGDPERTFRMMDIGLLPWWTLKEVKGAFWRPVTARTHWLDYQLWPDLPALMHAQSLLWFGGLVAAVTLLYRRLMGATWVAGLAALLYAIDDAHGMPVGFLANRNALLATFFGILTLLIHDRWRRDGRRYGAVLGPFLLGISLLSAEAGVATTAYLFAHVVFLDHGTWRRRFVILLPYGVVVLVWRLVWAHLGYGFSGSEPYVDPGAEPLRYAVAVVQRAPVLLLGQWALPPSDIVWVVSGTPVRLLWIGAVALLTALAFVMTPLLRRDRVARFWALGMILSVLPICAAFISDRLLFFVGIGAMGLLAQFLNLVFGRSMWHCLKQWHASLSWRIPAVSLGVLFVVIHMILAPIALPLRAAFPIGPKKLVDQLHVRTPMDRSVEEQSVVIINAPVVLVTMYLPILRELDGQPVPRHTRALAPGFGGVTVHRRDERTIVVRPMSGYLPYVFDRLVRGRHHPFVLGQRVELTGMTAKVTELTADGDPAEASFQFAVPLEDSSLRWLQWKDGAFVPFTPPVVGETVELPPAVPVLW